jgi:hypothetical protein
LVIVSSATVAFPSAEGIFCVSSSVDARPWKLRASQKDLIFLVNIVPVLSLDRAPFIGAVVRLTIVEGRGVVFCRSGASCRKFTRLF